MSISTVKLKAGINVELTPAALAAGYVASNNIRFRAGMAEKLGGWTQYVSQAVPGVPLFSHAWEDLEGNARFAAGTTAALCDVTGGTITNITPQTLITNPTVSLTTTARSNIVSIIDTTISGITVYDSVYFNTPISIDGIILSGLYPVNAYLSSTSYQIVAAQNGLAGVTDGGAVPAFTTAAGSSNVSVAFAAHGLSVGDDIVFPLATSAGGTTVAGHYNVSAVTDANNFVIAAAAAATFSAGPVSMNGGNAQYEYYIAIAPLSQASAYGTGNFGAGTFGFGSSPVAQTGTRISATDWSIDNWGELLIACPDGGGIYYWGPASGHSNASIVATAPPFNTGTIVSIAAQQVIAFGSSADASVGAYQDPLFIRWSDVGDFTSWTDLPTNQAGSFRIPSGSRIIGALAGASITNYVWTDVDLWTMNYTGSTLVYSTTQVAGNCGLIAKHAVARLGSSVYWMGQNSFFVLNGSTVTPLPCSVWDAVFQNINRKYASACFAGTNTGFNEVWFFWPSAASGGYCDMAAKVNVQENTWDISQIQRNTWIDVSQVPYPLATTYTGTIYQHESGADAGSSPMEASFQTSRFTLSEGADAMAFDRIYPDFKWGLYGASPGANIQISVNSYKYSGQILPSRTYGPFSVTDTTPYISQRGRGKWLDIAVSSSDSGSFWRLGAVGFRAAPDGRGVT